MIFYKNLKKQKNISEKNIVFSIFDNGVLSNVDDSVAGANRCKNSYNLSYIDGALKTGLGFRDIEVPSSTTDLENCHTFNFGSSIDKICGIWTERWYNSSNQSYDYYLVMIDTSYVLWFIPLIDPYYSTIWLRSSKLSSYPTFCMNYRYESADAEAYFSNEGMLYVTSNSEGLYDNVPAFISCVVHYDNFYAITNTDRHVLVYTSNLDLKAWTEGDSSTIELLDNRGSFNILVAFNDYVYLFREYGITRISIYSTKNDFSFTHLYTSTSKIYENSVCVCGSKVLFMTRDGLYSFKSSTVSKVAENFDKYFKNLDNTNCSSACINGKYYLATKCSFDDDKTVGCESSTHTNNVLFEIDIETFDVNIYRGVDIRKILAVDNPYMSKLVACFYDTNYDQQIGELITNGATFGTANEKCWQSFKTDLGYQAKRKKVKEIILTSIYPIEVEIKSDEESKTYQFSGSEKEQRLSVSVTGKTFQFTFKTSEQYCEIKKPMIVFDVVV